MESEASLIERDYFSDYSLLSDPYSYFEAVRAKGPVAFIGDPPVLFVTGFEEAVSVLKDTEHFSSLLAATGPLTPLTLGPHGDDITDQIEASRSGNPLSPMSLLVTYDGKQHADLRALLAGIFTPGRLKANEDFMARHAARVVSEVVDRGGCELFSRIAAPYVTYVIADLLGVPDEDWVRFMDVQTENPPAGYLGESPPIISTVLRYMFDSFMRYLTQRRENPGDDVMTELATARFRDGSQPPIFEIVKAAMFLFTAGQDTSALLLGSSIFYLAEHPELQEKLRQDNSLIPAFIEEMMRLEGSLKMTSRLARKSTRIGAVEVPAGTRVAVVLAAANRDPRRWNDASTVQLDRPKAKEHLGFSRGAHTCLGAGLARSEVRIMLEQFVNQTSAISIDETKHGPAGNRQKSYVPSFMNRGLTELHVRLEPRSA